jgi:hypothetical protein
MVQFLRFHFAKCFILFVDGSLLNTDYRLLITDHLLLPQRPSRVNIHGSMGRKVICN